MRSDVKQIMSDLIQSRSSRVREGIDEQVAAVVTVEQDVRFFPLTMRALLDQDVLPGTIVVADCSGGTSAPDYRGFSVRVDGSPLGNSRPVASVNVQIVRAVGARSFADAVNKGMRYAHLGESVKDLWLLHDDSRPMDRRCLASLTEARRNTPTASLFGAKQLDWIGENLHNVGYYAGRHSLESLVVEGESDQEQYDTHNDVFAVSLAGALVPLQTLERFGGINPWFGSLGEAGDFCRRICLSGGRVVVVPQARIAHRRVRVEGGRSKSGAPLDEQSAQDTSMERITSQVRYGYTDLHRATWPLVWLLHVVASIVLAIRELLGKRPYAAWCMMCSPWYLLSVLAPCLRARGEVSRGSTVALSALPALRADRRQMRQWRVRRRMFESQHHAVLLSVLDKMHLRRRAMIRRIGVCLLAVAVFGLVVLMQWDTFKSVLSGASLYSSSLAPSAADFSDLFTAATTPWAFGAGIGVSSPPAPWLLVWLAASVLTLGHPAVALSLLYFGAAPVCAVAFWALAGVFTRSNFVRVAAGLIWVALSWGLGLYQTANLPMLTVMMFLPAAFAFVFHAVGMYRTESTVRAHPSAQMAACAALCFIPVVCAEPQLLLPLVVIFLVFILMVRSHRAMLLLIPLPAALSVAPTLVHAAHYAGLGLWRQLFADVMITDSSAASAPRSLDFIDVLFEMFGVGGGTQFTAAMWHDHLLAMLAVVAVLAIVVLAAVCLALPFALRASRMMWATAICGVLLALASVRVAVAPASSGAASGSVLPGVVLAMMAWMGCICILAGGAVQRYAITHMGLELVPPSNQSALDSQPSVEHTGAAKVGRSALVVALLAVSSLWFASGIQMHANEVQASAEGLPMVAVDYLRQNEDHRILALRAQSSNTVSYTVMRTRRGDLMDVSPGHDVQQLMGLPNDADAELAKASAGLLAHSDDDAVNALAHLGFGGIYVVKDTSSAMEATSRSLSGNVNASDGVQALVQADGGTYYQLSDAASSSQKISSQGRVHAESSPWRYAWGLCFAIVLVLYCLVALPRISHRNIGEA